MKGLGPAEAAALAVDRQVTGEGLEIRQDLGARRAIQPADVNALDAGQVGWVPHGFRRPGARQGAGIVLERRFPRIVKREPGPESQFVAAGPGLTATHGETPP